ncbi:MAG: hypothetical protein ACC707_18230, partial [Thiohalomonadales bacterium]
MWKIKQAIFVFILLLPLGAHANFQSVMDDWIGATEETVIYQWGDPDATDRDDNATIYYYKSYRSSQSLGPKKCEIRFYIVNGIVDKYRWKGDN